MKKSVLSFALLFSVILFTSSCKKDAGEGGTSSITGKIYEKDYNSTFQFLISSYYAGDKDVYIIYGDDLSYGDKVSTSYDGTFEFKYLRNGSYKIYTYSKDSTMQSVNDIPIVVSVDIADKKQVVSVKDIVVFN